MDAGVKKPVRIRKYPNRRLYVLDKTDVSGTGYVPYSVLIELVRKGYPLDIRMVPLRDRVLAGHRHSTPFEVGEDVTYEVLLKAFCEHPAAQRVLGLNLLTSLLKNL